MGFLEGYRNHIFCLAYLETLTNCNAALSQFFLSGTCFLDFLEDNFQQG